MDFNDLISHVFYFIISIAGSSYVFDCCWQTIMRRTIITTVSIYRAEFPLQPNNLFTVKYKGIAFVFSSGVLVTQLPQSETGHMLFPVKHYFIYFSLKVKWPCLHLSLIIKSQLLILPCRKELYVIKKILLKIYLYVQVKKRITITTKVN
jgi:hypothetical protein